MIMYAMTWYILMWCHNTCPWYDDEHACFDVMTLFYALWCVLDIYTLHTRWWLYIPDDDCTHLMMRVHTWWWQFIRDDNDAHLWRCRQRRTICSVKVYDDVYKDVHEKCVALTYTGMIWHWSECKGYQQQIQSLVCDRSTGSAISSYVGGGTGQGNEFVASFRL